MVSCFALRFAVLVFILMGTAATQQSPTNQAVDNDFVQKEFGSTCSLLPGPAPMVADLNGDGIDDIALVARCTNPLIDEAEHNYKVADPYNSFFGYGDPKITSGFASEDPAHRGLVVLVIHGSGADAWRSASPKAKFILINLPFKQVEVKKLKVRKKAVMAIYADEASADRTTSATFWDGRKYKYQPLGSSME